MLVSILCYFVITRSDYLHFYILYAQNTVHKDYILYSIPYNRARAPAPLGRWDSALGPAALPCICLYHSSTPCCWPAGVLGAWDWLGRESSRAERETVPYCTVGRLLSFVLMHQVRYCTVWWHGGCAFFFC